MRITECVDIYVEMKRASGFAYESGNSRLRSFAREVGNIPLEEVLLRDVEGFMDARHASDYVWQTKYGLLRHFFEYWRARYPLEHIPMPPRKRALPPQVAFPHIYSQPQLQRLLSVASQIPSARPGGIEPRTLRTLILFIYGTGCRLGEARALQLCDVDLVRQTVIFRGGQFGRTRTVPICPDLNSALRKYLREREARRQANHPEVFLNDAGKALPRTTLDQTFRRLREACGICTTNGRAARLNDLRATFVVQRLNGWYREGADLSRMIPALAAYTGHAGTKSIERYLRLTPDRFRKQLDILSSQPMRRHWRDDSKLMRFLASLQE